MNLLPLRWMFGGTLIRGRAGGLRCCAGGDLAVDQGGDPGNLWRFEEKHAKILGKNYDYIIMVNNG